MDGHGRAHTPKVAEFNNVSSEGAPNSRGGLLSWREA